MKYGLDDKLSVGAMFLYGLQWWVVSLPCVVILGTIAAGMYYSDPSRQIAYVQQLFLIMGLTMTVQIFLGHRLPLNPGPASTLLIGMGASMSLGPDAQYSATALCGVALAVIGFCGLIGKLRRLFTPRIVSVVLILIATTLIPTILRLMFPNQDDSHLMAGQFVFVLIAVFILFYANTRLPGLAKSLTVLLGIVVGSTAYILLFGSPGLPPPPAENVFSSFRVINFVIDPGALLAFVFCFLALAINEIGSIESLGHMLEATDMDSRLKRGMGLTGVANAVSGCFGLLGPVDYALSSGVIAATGCATRYAMIPAGVGLIACGFSPTIVSVLVSIPTPVMGVLFLYLMSTQLASGILMLKGPNGLDDFSSGVIIALPLMVGLAVTFAPPALYDAFPSLLRPLLANGFVMGIITVLILEHWLLRKKTT
ncbi:MAG: purine/pyrimidine permease [Planctomycetaceae bacterium]|nr:purine/pyrimidine permease [Planctomycetaceae bacterium]